ncbi:acyl-CoA dehydrogenase family protein [Megasphaera massiliensis]|uniref:acyl-CoA dehydrogenase family protein n=1 Tax=Megasphaera massiliensis TaxID=1232428 RepID=UPI0034A02897
MAQGTLDAGISYAKECMQFHRPITDNQGIRWYIADIAIKLEAARLLTLRAAASRMFLNSRLWLNILLPKQLFSFATGPYSYMAAMAI